MTEKEILEQAKGIFPKLQKLRRKIHSNPELSFVEFETCKFIQNELSELGIESKVIGNTGVVATIGKGNQCVGLRADIDALPIKEETGLEFASLNEGVMHACGHDMHTTMLIGAAEILKKNEDSLGGIVKLIFQPGEEKLPGGASILIEEGVLENPKVDAIFGQHIYPGESEGTISLNSGPVMGAPDELYFTIKGTSTHAAQPHLGHDPIVAASQLIVHFQTLMTKYKDPIEAGVLSITSIKGGNSTNIIPDDVKLMGTLRSFNEQWRTEMHRLIEVNSKAVCELYGCEIEIEIKKGYPPVVNDEKITDLTINNAINLVGEDNTKVFEPKMWGEDFAFYGKNIPATFWFVGVRPKNLKTMPALHNSKLSPSENAMPIGTAMLVTAAINYLKG
ncbi:MAG: M20 family metallopeptidase [Candidatus Kapaibacterium sp.]|nr:amidohydrolase [Ignavibacteriota bacterium]MCB9220430.1 amidohydrolase [Ignavibacteria bacterium]